MATRKQSGTATEDLVDASSISPVIEGVETSNNIDATSGDGISPVGSTIFGFVETEKGFVPIVNEEDIYKYRFVGIVGDDKVYRILPKSE